MSELSALTGGEGYGACADDAGIAHLVERHLAKVEVASSSLVARSRKAVLGDKYCFFHRQDRTRCLHPISMGGSEIRLTIP